jgi:hypothetical protein
MRHSFYDSLEYRATQRIRTQHNQIKGMYVHLKKQITHTCARNGCSKTFSSQPSNPKRFCSKSCSAKTNNLGRRLSESVRQKISVSLTGKISPYKGVIKVLRVQAFCANPACRKSFTYEKYKARQFCSVPCAMKITGGQPTSPKASRGKAGIRKDIDDSIYFYSRWEANIARLYIFLGIAWVYAPTSFDIGGQKYTPDFYLPERNMYIEVKNFWNEFSKNRDEKFRKAHPNVKLQVILKNDYLRLEKRYANYIPAWEYKNTKFEPV